MASGATGVGEGVAVAGVGVGEGEGVAVAVARGDGAVDGVVAVEVEVTAGAGVVRWAGGRLGRSPAAGCERRRHNGDHRKELPVEGACHAPQSSSR